jgi:hypothetical protein
VKFRDRPVLQKSFLMERLGEAIETALAAGIVDGVGKSP